MSLNPRAAGEVNSASVRWSWSEPPMSVPRLKIEDSNSASIPPKPIGPPLVILREGQIQHVPESVSPWSTFRAQLYAAVFGLRDGHPFKS